MKELARGGWKTLLMEPDMYRKVLVPLDRSIEETGGVLAIAKDLLVPEGEGILLHIIPPGVPITVGLFTVPAKQVEEDERRRAMGYLSYFANQLSQVSGRWRCEVAVSASVADEIVDTAAREEVDLIAMYTHDREGIDRLIKGSIAEKVKERAHTEVRVIRPYEMVAR